MKYCMKSYVQSLARIFQTCIRKAALVASGGVFFSLLALDGVPAGAAPAITGFSPASGTVGTGVTIVGTNFSPIAASNIVYFGPVRAPVTAASVTNLTVTVPAGASYAPITATVNGLTAYANSAFLPTFQGAGTPVD